ncbi:hypothetical protein CJ030_MR0G004584 [Morella rubra]|uniref:F-box associated beta-propeller type 1 domain-containing protein n=1 Tax=Morella rubra TaxID=262757 RepID=A0A6A1UM17_9ROSI|nr:hypothetical protein CJ030_MR0G004584 [Morella rubra]
MLKTNELPKDVIAENLLWLLVISLLRFKCVCKAWYPVSLETLHPLQRPYLHHIFGSKKVEIHVVGSCNGLICLCDNYNLYTVLWNPATKETKVVPRSNVPGLLGYVANSDGIGFGFDVETNDYKITLFTLWKPDPNLPFYENDFRIQNEVYCLSTNSRRKVDSLLCVPIYEVAEPGLISKVSTLKVK